jgi:hypothetical protein
MPFDLKLINSDRLDCVARLLIRFDCVRTDHADHAFFAQTKAPGACKCVLVNRHLVASICLLGLYRRILSTSIKRPLIVRQVQSLRCSSPVSRTTALHPSLSLSHSLILILDFVPNRVQMSEDDAFEMMKHLLFHLGLRRQYKPDMSALQVTSAIFFVRRTTPVTISNTCSPPAQMQMYQLTRLLYDHHRDLYEHFERYDVSPTLYAAPWFLTLFASQFPIAFVARLFGKCITRPDPSTLLLVQRVLSLSLSLSLSPSHQTSSSCSAWKPSFAFVCHCWLFTNNRCWHVDRSNSSSRT